MIKASGVILAGGKSSRMGFNKAFLEFGNGKMIDKVVEVFKRIFDEIIIVSNDPESYKYLGVKVVPDKIPGRGPLSGIHSGLSEAENLFSFVTACDMPFLDQKLIEKMLEEVEDFDVLVPRLGEYLQPLFAIYSKNCIRTMEDYLGQNKFKLTGFYPLVQVKYLPEEFIYALVNPDKVFFNINTKEDLKEAKELL